MKIMPYKDVMVRAILLFVVSVVFLSACGNPKAETPQDAMIDSAEAARIGDEVRFFARVWVTDPTLKESSRATFLIQLGKAKLKQARIETFGFQSLGAFDMLDSYLEDFSAKEESIRHAKVVIRDDTATLEIAGMAEPMLMIRREG